MSSYYTSNGGLIRLGPVLGKGGEGTVHAIAGNSQLAAKIYLPGLSAERRDKIAAMADAKLHISAKFVAFPIDTVFDRSGAFAGFTMRKAGGHKPVHQLYSPAGRKTEFPKASYPLLVRAISNVARAIASVHTAGCTIGDVNHSGVLIAQDATVVLIDSDSFQFTHAGRLFPCKVGVPEFTPPELQGKPLDKVIRSTNHDAFGLAVLIFYTLFMGRHPFAGRYLDSGDMPMDRAIAEFRFAYSTRHAATRMEPPPNVPTLADLPRGLADAFERSFGPAGSAGARPSAADWVMLLDKAEAELVPCSQSVAHHFFKAAPSCPWCRMERSFPGFQAFALAPPVASSGKPLDLAQLVTAVRGVPDPGPAPNLVSLMPPLPSLQPSQAIPHLRRSRRKRWTGATVGAIVGLSLFATPGPGAVIGFVILLACAAVAFITPTAHSSIKEAARKAELAWRNVELSFKRTAGNEYFHKLRDDAEKVITELRLLFSEETRRLSELDAKRRDHQLRRHMERHTIDQVRIKGVGNARKLTLKSYGIETAADVDYARVIAIHGFGPSTANALVAWRQAVQAQFRFNPNEGVNPLDIAAVKSDIARRQADAESRLRQTVAALQKASADSVTLKTNPESATIAAWTAWKQAKLDAKALAPTVLEIGSFSAVLLAALVLALTLRVAQNARFPSTSASADVVSSERPSLSTPMHREGP